MGSEDSAPPEIKRGSHGRAFVAMAPTLSRGRYREPATSLPRTRTVLGRRHREARLPQGSSFDRAPSPSTVCPARQRRSATAGGPSPCPFAHRSASYVLLTSANPGAHDLGREPVPSELSVLDGVGARHGEANSLFVSSDQRRASTCAPRKLQGFDPVPYRTLASAHGAPVGPGRCRAASAAARRGRRSVLEVSMREVLSSTGRDVSRLPAPATKAP